MTQADISACKVGDKVTLIEWGNAEVLEITRDTKVRRDVRLSAV